MEGGVAADGVEGGLASDFGEVLETFLLGCFEPTNGGSDLGEGGAGEGIAEGDLSIG